MTIHHNMTGKGAVCTACAMLLLSLWTTAPADAREAMPQAGPVTGRTFDPGVRGDLDRASVMLAEGNYAGAIDRIKSILTRRAPLSKSEEQEATFMLAEALYHRGDDECVALLRDFTSRNPASPLALKARLSIADFRFFAHQWHEALEEYESIDFGRLNRSQLPLYSYRKMLSLINTGHYAEARPLIKEFSQIPEYRDAATFYTAYLDYIDGDLDRAYRGFERVKAGEKGLDAGYYLTQIEFTRGEYDNVIQHGRSLLRKMPVSELVPETNRIVGISYFKNGDYPVARQFLTAYTDETDNPSPQAVYALGVCDYEDGDYDGALEKFQTLTDLNNDIAQSAWLFSGQCYVKLDREDAAAMAFEKAARMEADSNVSETALYNYVASITRGGKVPFSSSADLLESFITRYPDSEYAPQVEEYLATAYYNDRNYAKALRRIEAIRNPSARVLAAKQKILYELGAECVSNGRDAEAEKYLRQSIALAAHDRKIAAQARLWLGDACYAQGEYGNAAEAYREAVRTLPVSANRTTALYDYAYSLYMLERYKAAAGEFAKAIDAQPELPSSMRSDAVIRRADCLYYSGDYAAARNGYSEAIGSGAADADYAAYRHAVMLGLAGDVKGKLSELSAMEKKYPGSQWLPTALLEKALTYEGLGQTNNATEAYRRISRAYPNAAQSRKALLSLALADMKAGRSADAVESYQEIIRRWPSSEEAQMANDDLRRWHASQGSLNEYAQFLKSVPGAKQLDADEMEQLAFDGAETAFADDASAITLLRNYVRDYPDGKYLAQALLDIAISLRDSGKYAEAQSTLERLMKERPHSAQYPEALLMSAGILENNLPGRTADALKTYRLLERNGGADFAGDAWAGIMRTSDNAEEQIAYARKVRTSGGLTAEQTEEASLTEARALLQAGRPSEALILFNRLAENPASLNGAKAAVELAQYYLSRKEYSKAEKTALEFTDAGTPHQYWLAKGFIALADAYHGQGKNAIAKEYLRSLRDNYPGSEKDIHSAISSRLKSWK